MLIITEIFKCGYFIINSGFNAEEFPRNSPLRRIFNRKTVTHEYERVSKIVQSSAENLPTAP